MAKDDLYKFFEYDVDLTRRLIYIGSQKTSSSGDESGVDAHLAEKVVKALILLELTAPDGNKPINIILNNPGGDQYHCIAIYDAIKHCKNKVIIKVYGMAMSAASIILQAADSRIISPNSKLMIHYGSLGTYDHPKIFYKLAEEGKKIDNWMENVYLSKIREKHPNFKMKDLQEKLNFDTFLSAEEALNLGLVDEIES